MLTSKSNFNTLRYLKGKKITEEALRQLYNNCISKDFINLNGNISKGYPAEIATFILNKIDTNNKEAKIVVLNDLSFHMYNCLTDAGILPENILLAFGKWNKDGTISDNKKVYNIMKMYAEANFVEFKKCTNIISLEEMFEMKNMKFDYVISNPPYEIGNIITKGVIDNVQFGEFIDLEPISNFRPNKLYQHIKSIQIIPCSDSTFDDAATNPHIYTLSKEADKSKTWEQIQLETYDKKWRKYYEEQLKRESSYIYKATFTTQEMQVKLDSKKCFMLTHRTGVDGVHKTPNCFDYKWNVQDIISLRNDNLNIADIMWNPKTLKHQGLFMTFNTAIEKQNITSFWYNSKIMTPIVRGLNKQGSAHPDLFLPKVDWTCPWTDEEILRDYGYTEDEIEQILKEENTDAN